MQTNVESSQIVFVKGISGNEVGKKITFQIDSGVINLNECCMNHIFSQRNANPTVQVARLNNCAMTSLKQCDIILDGVPIARYNDLSEAQNVYWLQKHEIKEAKHAVSIATPYTLCPNDYQIINGALAENTEYLNFTHQLGFKHFFPFVFEDVEFLDIKSFLQIEITLSHNSPVVTDGAAIQGCGLNNGNLLNQFVQDATMRMQYEQLQLVLQKYDKTILDSVKTDNELINYVNQQSFFERKITFGISNEGEMKRELFYIKKEDENNLHEINQFASTAITSADITANGNQLIYGKTYEDVFTQFELWQKHESNYYMIDTEFVEALVYTVDIGGALADVEIGVIYY